MVRRVQEILDDLDAAARPSDMNQPGYRLHRLSGELVGHWSVRVTGNWRIVFQFDGADVEGVRLDDYH